AGPPWASWTLASSRNSSETDLDTRLEAIAGIILVQAIVLAPDEAGEARTEVDHPKAEGELAPGRLGVGAERQPGPGGDVGRGSAFEGLDHAHGDGRLDLHLAAIGLEGLAEVQPGAAPQHVAVAEADRRALEGEGVDMDVGPIEAGLGLDEPLALLDP